MTKLSRREFLRGTVLAGAGALLPKVEQPTEQARTAEADERVIEVNTGPEIANWDFESYHSVSFDFEQCIANLPGLRGFWPWPKPADWDLEPYLARCPRTDLHKPITKWKVELSMKYSTPPSTPQRIWHTVACRFVPEGTRQVFLNE